MARDVIESKIRTRNSELRSNDEKSIPKYRGADLGRLGARLSPLWAQKPKSKKEAASHSWRSKLAKTPDERIAAIEEVLTNFADTEFKTALLTMAVQTEEQKNDYAQMVFYADRLLKADPMNTFALGHAGVGNRPAHARKRSG